MGLKQAELNLLKELQQTLASIFLPILANMDQRDPARRGLTSVVASRCRDLEPIGVNPTNAPPGANRFIYLNV